METPSRSAARQVWDSRAIWRLLWPLLVEQILTVTMGFADTVMVSCVGEHAVSGVSLVDQITILLQIAFAALATGGSVVVSQYIGRNEIGNAENAAKQLVLANLAASLVLGSVALVLHAQILRLVYGAVAENVFSQASLYFTISAVSYPALALYNSCAAIYRGAGDSRTPMLVAVLVNVLNIAGNALFIFGFGMGADGAALSTLISRLIAAVILSILLLRAGSGLGMSLRGITKTRFDGAMLRRILRIGVPSGIESSFFQLGKILLARVVTGFGTAAIAANAITGSLTALVYMPGQGFGLALVTIVGQCMGAGNAEDAKRYTRKIMKMAYASTLMVNVLLFICRQPLFSCFRLSPEGLALAMRFLYIYLAGSCVAWPSAFVLPNALRAAGDARYVMGAAALTMWFIRICAALALCYPLKMGAAGVWAGMTLDFFARAACYIARWRSEKWRTKKVI